MCADGFRVSRKKSVSSVRQVKDAYGDKKGMKGLVLTDADGGASPCNCHELFLLQRVPFVELGMMRHAAWPSA